MPQSANDPALPSAALLARQAEWLAPARARLLRRVTVARRRRLLDLGAGAGAVTGELQRRGGGTVVAVDRLWPAVADPAWQAVDPPAIRAVADAHRLPFANGTFDLVFSQCALMWMADPETAVAEIRRVLQPGGVLVALEPDYGGLVEAPPAVATRALWLAVLPRLGADPQAGRRLPRLLAAAGLQVRVDLLESVVVPSPARFDFLRSLPLTPDEAAAVDQAAAAAAPLISPWSQIAHLPFFLITATRSPLA